MKLTDYLERLILDKVLKCENDSSSENDEENCERGDDTLDVMAREGLSKQGTSEMSSL